MRGRLAPISPGLSVSGEHAVLRWTGACWDIKDLIQRGAARLHRFVELAGADLRVADVELHPHWYGTNTIGAVGSRS
jgi:hypothetical protein